MKSLYFLVLLLSISLIADVDAGWKFWKKKDDNNPTTETPLISNSGLVTPASATVAPKKNSPTTKAPAITTPTTKAPVNKNKALAGAADPGLVSGIGNTGGNIRDNARPQRPNPETEVGLDLPKPKVGSNGYRDWAIELTGAGEERQPSKLPTQSPTSSPRQPSRPGTQTPRPATPVQTPKPDFPSLPAPSSSLTGFGAPSSGSRSPSGGKSYAQAVSGGIQQRKSGNSTRI